MWLFGTYWSMTPKCNGVVSTYILNLKRLKQRRRKVYKIGGALKARIIKIVTSKRAFVHSIPFVCQGREELELPNPLQSVCTVSIWHSANNQSLQPSLHIVKHAKGGGGVCPTARIVEAFDALIIFMHEKTLTIQEN